MHIPYALILILVSLFLPACGGVTHDSPFDPETVADRQAKATVAGVINLEGEQDHSQVAVELQNKERTYSVSTRNDGSYQFTGVVPGKYILRFTARSFAAETLQLEVGLAESADIGAITLPLKTALVAGNAWLETVEGTTAVNIGGVRVKLVRTAGVRGTTAAPAWGAMAPGENGASPVFTVVSDSDGSYTLFDVPAGEYGASAEAPGQIKTDLGTVKITGEDGDVTLDDAVLRPLNGLFDIDAGGSLNPVFTSANDVTLRLYGFNALEMAVHIVTEGTPCAPVVRVPYAATSTLPLAGEGSNVACVRFFGEGSSQTDVFSRVIVRDTTAPDAALFAIDGGASASTDFLGRVSLSIVAVDGASGVARMKLANATTGGCPADLTGAADEPFVSLKGWVLGATPEAQNFVCLALADGVGNWSAPVSTSVLWDAVAPANESIIIAGGAALATATRVTLALAADGAAEMQLTDSGSFTGRPWEPFRAAAEWTFANVQGAHEVKVRFRDAAGNLSAEASDTIGLDTIPPAAPGLVIAGGSAVTRLAAVVLTPTATDAAEMQFSNDGLFDAAARYPLAATHAWTLSPGDGVKTVFVRFFDTAGNTSAVATDTIVFDTTPPVSGSLVVDAGATFNSQSSGSAALTLAAVDTLSGMVRMRVANWTGAGCATDLDAASPEPYATSRGWTLALPGIDLEGTRRVCASFEDMAGNWSPPVSDSVQYDTRAPQGGSWSVGIAGGAAYALATQVQLALAATGATEMQVANDGSFGAATWEPYRTSTFWVLNATEGGRSVDVKFRDAAGNISAMFSDTIDLDTQRPGSPAVAINGGAAYATLANVTLTLGASGANFMQISSDGIFDEPEQAYGITAGFNLPGTDGTKFVYARFRDLAGNWSEVASAYVVLDRIAPIAGTVLIDGDAVYTQTGSVTLSLPASGVYQMYLSGSACLAGSSWIDYVPTYAFALGATQGLRTVSVNYRDEAGNVSPCKQDTITTDGLFSSPGFAAAVTGTEGVGGRTKNQAVWVTLSSVSADVSQVSLSADAAFSGASWQTKATKNLFVVGAGDGLKTIYVRARDAAGNLSSTLSPTITLDQTGPEAPAISVSDVNGDSFAVSSADIELRWTSPSDANLAGFDVERYIPGYTATFAPALSAGAATLTFTDSITDSTGLAHIYRVRARDNLGNLSGWSSNTVAFPFLPVSQAGWLINSEGMRYLFAPNRGTFSVHGVRQYEDASGNILEEDLGAGISAWQNTAPGGAISEKLAVTTINQDNTLAYRSTLPTVGAQRSEIGPVFRHSAIEMDSLGTPHVINGDANRIYYGPVTNGIWSRQSSGGTATDKFNFTLDTAGKTHIVYSEYTPPNNLYYRTNKLGSWVSELIGTNASSMPQYSPVIGVGSDGIVHVVKYQNGTLTYLRRAIDGTWTTEAMFGGFAPSLAVNAAGVPYVAYRSGATVSIVYRTGVGTWTATAVDAGAGTSLSTALRFDATGVLHVAYGAPAAGQVRYAKSPTYTPQNVGAVIDARSLSLSLDGMYRPAVAYITSTGDAYVATYTTAWDPALVDTGLIATEDEIGVGLDALGNLYATYTDVNVNAQMLYRRKAGARDEVVTFATYYMSMKVDAAKNAHILYNSIFDNKPRHRWNAGGVWSEEVITTTTLQSSPSIDTDQWGGVHTAFVNANIWYGKRTGPGAWAVQSLGAGSFVKLAVDTTGGRHVIYNNGSLYYAYAASGAAFTAGLNLGSGLRPDITIDDTGTPQLVYASSTVLRHRSRIAGAWSAAQTVVSAGPGSLVSITARDGVLHLAYWDSANSNLYYMKRENGAWSSPVVVDRNLATNPPSVAALAGGQAAILYTDSINSRTKFATNVSGGWTVSRYAPAGGFVYLPKLCSDADYGLHSAATGLEQDSYHGVHYRQDFFGVMLSTFIERISAW